MAYPQIVLDTPTIIQPELTGSDVVVEEVRERPGERKVVAQVSVNGYQRVLTVWQNEEYDAVGQWTDVDMEARIRVLLNQ